MLGALFIGVTEGCASTPDPRPQLLLIVDTDAPLVGQLGDPPELSPALAVDTLRIDIIGDDRHVTDYRDVTAPDPRDWPLSFGIASAEGSPRTVRLRLRAFRSALARRGLLGETTTIEPPENALIDRVVEIDQPAQGVSTTRVVLSTACFGAPASFITPIETCIDAGRRAARPSEGLLEGTAPSLAGTAGEAREVPCAHESPKDAVCIPGGPTVLGDPGARDIVPGPAPAPLRPVLLSPFHMDRTEFTVGRYRALLARSAVSEAPRARAAEDFMRAYCTWLSPTDATNDALPVNCISYEGAIKACEAEGGQLPTEAQWEHAARGRGQSRRYPWGDEEAKCCSASISRTSFPDVPVQCGSEGSGVEPVGSHTERRCLPADVSRDGVLDLAGSLREAVANVAASYDHACWSGPGLRVDPRCTEGDRPAGTVGRGGDWSAGTFFLNASVRGVTSMPSSSNGFRCVYPDR